MKRIILVATMATLGISGLALAGGSLWQGHGTKDHKVDFLLERFEGTVHAVRVDDLKYGPNTDPDCTETGRTGFYSLNKELQVEDGKFHGHGRTSHLMEKGDGSVTMKVSGEFVSHDKAKGVVSLTDHDNQCTTKKTQWFMRRD